MGRAALRPGFPPAARVSLHVTPVSTVGTHRDKLWKPWKRLRNSFAFGGSSRFHFSEFFFTVCFGERVVETNRFVRFVLSVVGEERIGSEPQNFAHVAARDSVDRVLDV